jgi:hypothetical protein
MLGFIVVILWRGFSAYVGLELPDGPFGVL